ncbi:MAG: hypothetical protein GYA55_05625 [SAR324 cluster bacterium]|uniref:Uncharacterized protein n=1 Tax=SAR324 cluster bacterium TaxID=2024889 RepID=A0A7X9FQU8_9DELT|nr:hypothetical protein [SAR324 cluster bacterium]
MRRIGLIISLLLLSPQFCKAGIISCPAEREVITADPVASFIELRGVSLKGSGQIYRVSVDVDIDGKEDFLLGDSEDFGNAGGPWWLFRGMGDRKYKLLCGAISFHPCMVQFLSEGPGKGKIHYYWRSGANHGAYCDTIVQATEIKTTCHEEAEAFSLIGFRCIHERCSVSDYTRDGKCNWRN